MSYMIWQWWSEYKQTDENGLVFHSITWIDTAPITEYLNKQTYILFTECWFVTKCIKLSISVKKEGRQQNQN